MSESDWVDVPETSMSGSESDWVDVPTEASVTDLLGNDVGRGTQAARLAIGGFTKILPYNIGDEAVAGGSSLIDALKGEPLSSAYDRRLQELRDYQQAFKQFAPKSNAAIELGGALLTPFKSGVGQATGVIGKGVQAAKEGAALSALYGFGAGEGEQDRLKKGAENALIGGLLSPAIVGGASLLEKAPAAIEEAGNGLQRAAIGAKRGDYLRGLEDASSYDVVNGDIESATKGALDELISTKALGSSLDPSKLLGTALKQKKVLGDEVGSIVAAHDLSGAGGAVPEFDNALNYIASGRVEANKIDDYFSQLADLKSAIQKEGKGALSFLQNQKVAWGDKFEIGNDAANGFYRAVYRDLKDTVENAVPAVGPLNQQIAKIKLAIPILKRGLSAQEGSDLTSSLTKGAKSTWPLALVGSALKGEGGAEAGVGLSLLSNAANSKTGKNLIGKGLSGFSRKLPDTSGLSSAVSSKSPALIGEAISSGNTSKKTPSSNGLFSMLPSVVSDANASEPTTSPKEINPVKNPENDSEFGLILDALKQVESSGNAKAVGPKTKYGQAKGAYQILDSTAKSWGLKDPFDEPKARETAGKILQDELDRFGSIELALAAYNTGATNLNRAIKKAGSKEWEDVKPFLSEQTQKYVPKIEKVFEKLASNKPSTQEV